MNVSIIIPTYNRFDLLKTCLDSVEKYTNLKDKEIVIVSNGCKDKTVRYIKLKQDTGMPYKLLEFPRPIGFPKAINVGALASEGEYLVFLNNDAVILSSTIDIWIDCLMAPFLKDPMVGVTGPVKVENVETGMCFILFFCAMVRRSLYEELSDVDEIFSPGFGEDVDFCIRAQMKGYKIVQIPYETGTLPNGFDVVNYPINHDSTQTFRHLPDHNKNYARNSQILKQRYGK
jgi:GT2 family glycosyltransferase